MKSVVLLGDSDGAGGITVFDKTSGMWRVAGAARPVTNPVPLSPEVQQQLLHSGVIFKPPAARGTSTGLPADQLEGYQPSPCLVEGPQQATEPLLAEHVSTVEFRRRTCEIDWYEDWRIRLGVGAVLVLAAGGVVLRRRR